MHVKQWEVVSAVGVSSLVLPLTNSVTSKKTFKLSESVLSIEN